MFYRYSVKKIIIDHLKSFYIHGQTRIDIASILFYFVFPAILTVITKLFIISLDTGLINILITSVSIFGALLFNYPVILYSILEKQVEKNEQKNKILKETLANVSFCIILSITLVILLILINCSFNYFIINILTTFVLYFLYIFLLTLFMVIKRIYNLLDYEFNK